MHTLIAAAVAATFLVNPPAPAVAPGTVSIDVNAKIDRKPINPNIYGVACATKSELNELACPLNSGRGAADIAEFIIASKSAGAEPLLTIPTTIWAAGTSDGKLASLPSPQPFWVKTLVAKLGDARHHGVRYYALGSDPAIDGQLDKSIAYAERIKAIDPLAQILAPEAPYAVGSSAGLLQYLDAMHASHAKRKKDAVDIFTVHFSPQSGELGDDISEDMQLRRNRSTRILWDPLYADSDKDSEKVCLIPRLHDMVKKHDPGAMVGITEYNWGADQHMNGATTESDILGIFGREGLDMGVRQVTPDTSTPTYKAIQLYRNYDGAGSQFGNVSIHDGVPNPDSLSSFAAYRTNDDVLTVMVINKDLHQDAPIQMNITGFNPDTYATVWQLTDNQIGQIPPATIADHRLVATVPAQSVTLYVIRQSWQN